MYSSLGEGLTRHWVGLGVRGVLGANSVHDLDHTLRPHILARQRIRLARILPHDAGLWVGANSLCMSPLPQLGEPSGVFP